MLFSVVWMLFGNVIVWCDLYAYHICYLIIMVCCILYPLSVNDLIFDDGSKQCWRILILCVGPSITLIWCHDSPQCVHYVIGLWSSFISVWHWYINRVRIPLTIFCGLLFLSDGVTCAILVICYKCNSLKLSSSNVGIEKFFNLSFQLQKLKILQISNFNFQQMLQVETSESHVCKYMMSCLGVDN